MIKLDPVSTALVLIDLQKAIVGRNPAPHSGEQVVRNSIGLAEHFRRAGAPVVIVNVAWSKDGKDILRQPVDRPGMPAGGPPDGFAELVDGLAQPGDIRITKRQWSAFHGTELDLQLRRRGVQTIVLGGIATNIGVESTARQAWEHGYALLIAEDITSGTSAESHAFAFDHIFPRISRIVNSTNLVLG